MGKSVNGAVAEVTDREAFAGQQALVLEQQIAVKLPVNADQISNSAQYYKQLNNGQGGGFTLVDQRVPVEGGQAYDLRFAYRSEGLVRELRNGRPGYAIFSVWIFWGNEQGAVDHVWAMRSETNYPSWQLVTNPRSSSTPILGLPYVAPEGATYAQIRLQLVVNTATAAKVSIDQVEFSPVSKD